MNDLLVKIFDNVLIYEEDTIKRCNKIDNEVYIIAEQYKDKMNIDDLEKLKNDIFAVTLNAEHIGLEIGVKLILNLMQS